MDLDIETVKNLIRITDLAESEGVKIESNNMACCPFHDDSEPSMKFYPKTNTFACFVCTPNPGKQYFGGSIIDWIMKSRSVDKGEAVKIIKQLAGISEGVPVEIKPISKPKKEHKKIDPKLKDKIFNDFYSQLELTEKGFIYLTEQRKLDTETISKFKFKSIDTNFKITNHMKKHYDIESLIDCGLFGKNKEGKYYLRYLDCVVFPYFDHSGKPIYFEGKPYKKSKRKSLKMPKIKQKFFYWNLKEQQQYIFESVLDAVSFYQLTGKDNIIATGGTGSINIKSINNALKKVTGQSKEIILAVDNDAGGNRVLDHESDTKDVIFVSVSNTAKDIGIVQTPTDWNELLQLIEAEKIKLTPEEIEYLIDYLQTDIPLSSELSKKVKNLFSYPEIILSKEIVNHDKKLNQFIDDLQIMHNKAQQTTKGV